MRCSLAYLGFLTRGGALAISYFPAFTSRWNYCVPPHHLAGFPGFAWAGDKSTAHWRGLPRGVGRHWSRSLRQPWVLASQLFYSVRRQLLPHGSIRLEALMLRFFRIVEYVG